MRILDEKLHIKVSVLESGIRIITSGDEAETVGVCLDKDNGGLVNLIPIFSPTGRMFFKNATSCADAPNRYFFIPKGLEMAKKVSGYGLQETDCEGILMLDTVGIKDNAIVLREQSTQDGDGKIYVINFQNDHVECYDNLVDYDRYLCSVADRLENLPVPGYENRKYSFSPEDWVSLEVPPFCAFPDGFPSLDLEEDEEDFNQNDILAE